MAHSAVALVVGGISSTSSESKSPLFYDANANEYENYYAPYDHFKVYSLVQALVFMA